MTYAVVGVAVPRRCRKILRRHQIVRWALCSVVVTARCRVTARGDPRPAVPVAAHRQGDHQRATCGVIKLIRPLKNRRRTGPPASTAPLARAPTGALPRREVRSDHAAAPATQTHPGPAQARACGSI